MADPFLSPEQRDLLAAELALGVLEGEERAAAIRLQMSDAAFAGQVREWSARLEPLAAQFKPAPGPDVWQAIERRLPTVQPAVADLGPGRLRAWRWGALGSGALAASLAVALLMQPRTTAVPVSPTGPQQVVIAELSDTSSGARLLANYDPERGLLRIRAVTLPRSSLAPELWVIGADQVPRSLGLVDPRGTSQVTVAAPHRQWMQEGATLAVTMEPVAGAPHDKPSSTPIAVGKISTV